MVVMPLLPSKLARSIDFKAESASDHLELRFPVKIGYSSGPNPTFILN